MPQGHCTLPADDAGRVLDRLAGLEQMIRPEIVLLDIGLPGMSGHEVAEQLRRRPWFKGCLLVAVTGWGQEKDRAASRAVGFDHHLVKPVNQTTIHILLHGNLPPDH